MIRVILVMSDGNMVGGAGPFYSIFDNAYAAGFASHFRDRLTAIAEVPSVLPEYLDEPASYLPESLPEHDALIAINIHDEILLELPALCSAAGGKAIVIPREDPDWTSPWLRGEMAKSCAAAGMEISFPKPFCSLVESPDHPVINRLMQEFKIGRPELKFTIKDGIVENVEVIRSAPCGDTYYVAANLKGKAADDKLDWWAFKFWGSYPCRGSMKFDPEFNDSFQHEAGHILIKQVHEALDEEKEESDERDEMEEKP